ncbi:MAG: c-type cytochrome [Anaerolineales bacterium]|jgi:cytochrome c551/c552|nr:c-type cytochrome [Anaerolineales bacterium]
MKKFSLVLLLMISFLLLACEGTNSSSASDIKAGELLFKQSAIGSQVGCITCHSLEPDVTLIGPSLAGIGARAATLVAGQSAEVTLTEAIINPDADIAEGFVASIMPKGYEQALTAEQIAQLVAYMLSLE